MATRRWLWICVVGLQFPTFVHSNTGDQASETKIRLDNGKLWANELADKLETFFSGVIPYATLKQQYESSKRVTYRNVDGKKLVQAMGNDLSEFLGRKVDALWNATREAEEIAKNYKWNEKLKIDSVEYVNSKLLKRGDPMLVYDPMFKQAVNPNFSSVHIPVEIYEGKIEILNGLNWTAGLDKVFRANRERDPDLLWMFFGSQTGFMRTMPASRWKCNGEVDLYDVRRRPWYTQGSSSPKDMLILIDASGSVHGQALQLIKVAVQSLLDTLGDNDFFNIIKFSAEANYVHDCFNHTFVQANYRNKRILQEKVGELEAEGKADFKIGLTFAFEQFIRFRGNDSQNHGANCNEVIMLLTDGGSDKAKEVFEKYNWPNNKSVRVFTYTIGSTSDPTESIRWMACANRGFYSPIPAMGAIRSKVQDYVKVLSRPLALARPSQYIWTSVYKDSLGLGMLTTVTLPVYNRSESSNNQTILGVMGVDVATSRLMDYYPKTKLTPNGYSFAINQNGYIIFHPDLKAQYGWLQDPPNVDFLDIEYETEDKVQLRRKMIDGGTGEQRIKTMLVQADQRHVVEVNRTYFYTSINNSDFSLGIVIPDYAQLYPEVTENYTDEEGFALLSQNKTAMLISMNEYYTGYGKVDESHMTGTIQDLLKVKDTAEFNQDLLQLLFWDADITQNIVDYFRLMKGGNENSCSGDGVIAAFVGTNSGLTRVNWCQDNETNTVEQMIGERDVWRRPYYKRALEKDGYILGAEPFTTDPTASVNVGAEGNDTEIPDVMMVRAITIEPPGKNGKIFKPAVTGVKLEHSRLLSMMEVRGTPCEESLTEACYLLDDGGFVVATSVEKHFAKVGKFFGDVDCPVMFALYNESSTENTQIYSREIRVDHQASCPDQPEKTSFAGLRSIRVPTLAMLGELLTFNFWSSQLTWAYVNFNIYNWFFTPSYAYGAGDEEEGDTDCSPVSDDASTNHSCSKIEAHYYFQPDVNTVVGSLYCGNCTKDFMASKVRNTNLLLVVADIIDPECESECAFCDIMQAPREDDDPDNCLLTKRYRRRPEGCYSEDEDEDDSKCGSDYPLPSKFFILLVVIGTLILSQASIGVNT